MRIQRKKQLTWCTKDQALPCRHNKNLIISYHPHIERKAVVTHTHKHLPIHPERRTNREEQANNIHTEKTISYYICRHRRSSSREITKEQAVKLTQLNQQFSFMCRDISSYNAYRSEDQAVT